MKAESVKNVSTARRVDTAKCCPGRQCASNAWKLGVELLRRKYKRFCGVYEMEYQVRTAGSWWWIGDRRKEKSRSLPFKTHSPRLRGSLNWHKLLQIHFNRIFSSRYAREHNENFSSLASV
jgi:hypothetical protein